MWTILVMPRAPRSCPCNLNLPLLTLCQWAGCLWASIILRKWEEGQSGSWKTCENQRPLEMKLVVIFFGWQKRSNRMARSRDESPVPGDSEICMMHVSEIHQAEADILRGWWPETQFSWETVVWGETWIPLSLGLAGWPAQQTWNNDTL